MLVFLRCVCGVVVFVGVCVCGCGMLICFVSALGSHEMGRHKLPIIIIINFLVGPQEPLLATVKRLQLAWFGYVTRHDHFSKTIFHCTLESG